MSAIQFQPTKTTEPNFGIDSSQPQTFDENGEAIIAEGLCNRRGVCCQICLFYYLMGVICCSLFLFPVGLVLCILGCFYGKKAGNAWRLYLTPTSLHYTQVGASTCCYKDLVIPLSDIEDCFVQETIIVQQGGGVTQNHSVKVKIDRSKIEEYLRWDQSCVLPDYLELKNVANASDFATAVKRQLTAANNF